MWCFWTWLLLAAFAILLSIDLLAVLLSYSMCWCEHANADPQLMNKRFRGKTLALVASLTLQEIFFNLLTALIIPFGLTSPRRLPQQRGETPVLLLHGLFNNRASWFLLKRRLKQNGFNNVATINLSTWHNEEVLTELVAKKVDELRHHNGVNKVHLVGHSMGGIIARNYMQQRGGANKVERCVFLGAPHFGSKLAPLAFSSLGRVLIPGTDFLQRLAASPPPAGVKITNIYSRKDNMVLPNSNACLAWGESVELDGMGHTGLIYRKPAIDAVITALRQDTEQ